jgi:hypothetical protein
MVRHDGQGIDGTGAFAAAMPAFAAPRAIGPVLLLGGLLLLISP